MSTTTTLPYQESAIDSANGIDVLIQQCIQNDKRAQKELYERFAPLHYAKILRYVSEASEANEILNESFYKILTNLKNYTSTGSFEGWIHRITINTILDYLRKQKKYQHIQKEQSENLEVPIPETSVGKIAYKELLALVHSLPDVQRSVFNLFVFDECSHREIASMIGITENNSRWHLNDARRRLKEKIDALK